MLNFAVLIAIIHISVLSLQAQWNGPQNGTLTTLNKVAVGTSTPTGQRG